MLTAQSVHDALSHEFFRTSRTPFLGGNPGERPVPSLPGATCSRPTDWLNLPEREPPLIEACKSAMEYASRRMRETAAASPPLAANGNGNAAAPINEAPPPMPALAEPGEKRALLMRLNELSRDTSPQGEAQYQEVLRQIAALQ